MSLLLQALQKAARNREGQPPAADDAEATASRPLEPALDGDAPAEQEPGGELEELSLADEEELFGSDAPDAAREPRLGLPPAEEPLRATARVRPSIRAVESSAPQQAATILRASEAKGTGVIDWVRDRPAHAFAIAGGIFGVFYGAYVYLQIFHPGVLRGDFVRQPPLQAKTPPPAPRPLTPPEPAPAPAAAAAAVPPALAAAVPAPPGPAAPQVSAAGQPGSAPAGSTTKAGKRPAAQDPGDAERAGEAEELVEAAPRKPARRSARQAQVEVDNVTLDDAVSVRGPEAQPVPALGALTRAWEALQQGRYAEAQVIYDEVAASDPDNVDGLLGRGALAGLRGNTEQAARLYGRALELDPRNSAAQAGLISMIGQADPQLSETRLKQLISREPSAFLHFALGNLYAKQAAWPKAQQAYFQAYQLQPDNPDYAYNLAIGLEHLGQGKIALNYYRRALELRALRGWAEFDATRVEERIGQLAARVGSQ